MHSPSPRESRHVLVTGLPDTISEEKINTFFSSFGGVQGVERSADGVIVSFTDIRSARKAHLGDHRLDNLLFRMSFHDPVTTSKNPHPCMTNQSPQEAGSSRRRSISPGRDIERNRIQRPLNISIPKRTALMRKEGRGSISPATRSPRQGLQGFYILNTPRHLKQNELKELIQEEFKPYGTIADVQFEDINGGEDKRALVIYNSVKEQPEKNVMLADHRCRVRMAEPVDVQVAYNKTMAAKGAMATSTNRDQAGRSVEEYNIYHERATRTLYVGGLEANPTETSLRRRYERYGTILEIDVKNPESPSPFAFLHYTDIDSTVKAVNAYQNQVANGGGFTNKKQRVNFGRTNPSTKVWFGALPTNIEEEDIRQLLVNKFDGLNEIFYDPKLGQAVAKFMSTDSAIRAQQTVRTRQFNLKYEGRNYRLCADYATEGLLNYFRDRIDSRSSSFLTPPPNPPSDMSGSARADDRQRSPSQRHRRSRSKEQGKRRSRSGTRREDRGKETKSRGRSSSNDSSSSTSTGSSSSTSSSSSEPSPLPRQFKIQNKTAEGSKEKQKEKVKKQSDSTERAASGDSGFDESKTTLEPPPAPPPLRSPILATSVLKSSEKPPPPFCAPKTPQSMSNLIQSNTPLHPPGPPPPPKKIESGTSNNSHPEREKERRKEGAHEERSKHHDQLTKRSSMEKKDVVREPSLTEEEKYFEKIRIQPKSRKPNSRRIPASIQLPIPLKVAEETIDKPTDPRRNIKFYLIREEFPDLPIFDWKSKKVLGLGGREKPPSLGADTRKKSSGSVTSIDGTRRTSGGSLSRVESNDIAEPICTPTPSTTGEHSLVPEPSKSILRKAEPSSAQPTPTSTIPPAFPKLSLVEPPSSSFIPGAPVSRSGSISFEERLMNMKRMNSVNRIAPIRLSSSTLPPAPTPPGVPTPTSAPHLGHDTNTFGLKTDIPPPASARPNLHINIPPNGISFPSTPNSAKSDFSPKIDNARRVSTALPSTNNPPQFTPLKPPPTLPPLDQHTSPLLSAPPAPPLLPKPTDSMLKSPPITPGSRLPSISTPSPSVSNRPDPFKPNPQTPQTPYGRTPKILEKKEPPRQNPPFNSPNNVPFKDKNQQQRHESMSGVRSPPVHNLAGRSLSVSEKKSHPEHLWKTGKPNQDITTMKQTKVGKKSEVPLIGQKVKEHKKHKEHKMRLKPDGTYETKEERTKRREEKKKKKILMGEEVKMKKSKEEKAAKKKAKKEKKDKERMEKSEKKKKKKQKHTDDDDSDSETENEFPKTAREWKEYSLTEPQTTMYDRVKRRSSAVTKDDPRKQSALKVIKDKKDKKEKKKEEKRRLLLSSDEDDDEQRRESEQSSAESEMKTEEHPKKTEIKKKLEKERHVTSESESEVDYKTPVKKSKKERPKNINFDPDVFGADSSEDEEVKPPTSRKSKTSTSDESDHHKKTQKIDYASLFGTDMDEKKEKKPSPSGKHRKRQPSHTPSNEDNHAKRSKRGSMSSEMSVDTKEEVKIKKIDDYQFGNVVSPRGLENKPPIKEEDFRPRLLTKAAMKVFESTPSTSQLQLSEDDSEDSELLLQRSISSGTSDSESDSAASLPPHEEEHDEPEENSQESMDIVLDPSPAPPVIQAPQDEQYQQMLQGLDEPIRDLEGELAAQAIADDQGPSIVGGHVSIFDDCEEPIPEYPSHNFIRVDDPGILVDNAPLEISEEQIMMESFTEEPIPEDEEQVEEIPQKHPESVPMPIHTSTPKSSRISNDFPSPTSLAAHAVAVKSPLTVSVDGPIPSVRTPSHNIFSPSPSHLSNGTSPLRSITTPLSAAHQSPLTSPICAVSPHIGEERRPTLTNGNYTPDLLVARTYLGNIQQDGDKHHQQVPLQQHINQSPVHLNGSVSSFAAVPSPSHHLSGTSSISSPGNPPSFGKKMPPVWKGRIIIKNAAEVTVQMHYMFGQKEYVTSAMATLEREVENKDPSLRIGQRMKAQGDQLYRLLHRLQASGTTCLCVPVGNNPEEVQQHARTLKNEFADYFVKKGCAGVAQLDSISPKSFVYVFPPNEFTDQYLQHASPDLYSRIQNKLTEQFSYLFVAIAPAEEQ